MAAAFPAASTKFTLYGSKADWAVQKVLVAASYAGVSITLQEQFDAAALSKEVATKVLPVLKGAGVTITQSNSMLRMICRMDSSAQLNLYGASPVDATLVDQWMDYSLNEIELGAAVWTSRLLGRKEFMASKDAINQARKDTLSALSKLDAWLLHHMFIVGDLFTAADIAIACACFNLFKLVLSTVERKNLKNVTRWFYTCVNQPKFKAVVGSISEDAPAPVDAAAGAPESSSNAVATVAEDGFDSKVAADAAEHTAVVPKAVAATALPKGGLWRRKRCRVREILEAKDEGLSLVGQEVTVGGWVRSLRKQTPVFLKLNDGSSVKDIQAVLTSETTEGFAEAMECGGTGACVSVTGQILESQGKGQAIEIQAKRIVVHGTISDPSTYPMSKKRHTLEKLREHQHLRMRTNVCAAATRVRNACAYATHSFFQDRGFQYIHTPLVTGADCEGAGEMFSVTTLLEKDVPRTKEGAVDYTKDFFGKPSFLTVSGQINVECFSCAMSDVYTFGPTFRAEESHTSRHLAEFWMIEPEIAFADLDDDAALAEDYLKYCVFYVLDNCRADLEFLQNAEKIFAKQTNSKVEVPLIERLESVVGQPFARLTYTEAVEMLMNHVRQKKVKFDKKAEKKDPLRWGLDLRSEHERYLAETVYKRPVIVTDYPKEFKAFYMRLNDDNKTVRAMDILAPGIGEIVSVKHFLFCALK